MSTLAVDSDEAPSGEAGTSGRGLPAPGPARSEPAVAAGGRRSRRWTWLLLVLLGVGFLIRLDGIDAEVLTFHPTRQYRAALIARSFHLRQTLPPDDPARQNAELAVGDLEALEPPVVESVAALLYRVTGDELWVPRLLNACIWLLGAVACWSILGRWGTVAGRVVGTGTFLLLPMAVAGSRSFQPDPLMVSTALIGMALLLQADARRSRRGLWIAALVCAGSVLVKPMIAPLLVGWWLAVLVSRHGWRGLVAWRHVGLVALMIGPSLAYYVHRTFSQESLAGWQGSSFIPDLFLERWLYESWVATVDRAVPLALVALALAATLTAPHRQRTLLTSLWAGYVAFNVMVNYRAATHDYYHLPLIAIVALALGTGTDSVVRWVRNSTFPRPIANAVLGGVVLLAVVVALGTAVGPNPLEPRVRSGGAHVAANVRIGELTGHSRRILAVTPSYGADLAYQGGVVVKEYPSPADVRLQVAQGLPVATPAEILGRSGAEWFAVTDVRGLDALPELRAELRQHHRLVTSGPRWQLWRLDPARTGS